jgi:ClpP class serine protease
LRDALNDDAVSQILIDIDSPGGSVYGVAELADEILAARKQKPVVAIANSLAASAAPADSTSATKAGCATRRCWIAVMWLCVRAGGGGG